MAAQPETMILFEPYDKKADPKTTTTRKRVKKVLRIPELLENIIIHLPPRDVHETRLVCRHLYFVIKPGTPAIKRAKCLAPPISENKWVSYQQTHGIRGVPVYESGSGIKFNPTLKPEQGRMDGVDSVAFNLGPSKCDDLDELGVGRKFATSPPCQYIGIRAFLELDSSYRRDQMVIKLEGVRIGDLVQQARQLYA